MMLNGHVVVLRKVYSQATGIHTIGGIWIGVIRDGTEP